MPNGKPLDHAYVEAPRSWENVMRLAVLAVVLLPGMSCTCGTKVPDTTTKAPMTEDDFWDLIETARSRGGAPDEIAVEVSEELAKRSADDIRAFDAHRVRLMESSYSWNLWGAAYLINGGCSDDCFEYFRSWLISQGRQVFEGAVANPDTLAAHVSAGEEPECEDFLYAASKAHETATGTPLEGGSFRYPELGQSWDFDDSSEMSRRYPELWKKFGW